ncbi:OLC1v1015256C1 [Oldenlandia corymbosa var. corymbosa]|uniref:OLC1v1015256C1 n=1 Tax=Oldenlandia corymbosa var. corymbosa TaxID=529605 RepID=A0AAV1E2W1_OLDCO|nr:OLC1v1015256C1 [Oldenlandia corymbosa var. corymbosa]
MSLIYPREEEEAGAYHDCEFDPNADFAQFLEEARNHKCEEEPKGANIEVEQNIEGNGCQALASNGGAKRSNRKSWRSSLFSWLIKSDKKNKRPVVVETLQQPHKLRRGGTAISGPIIHGGGGGDDLMAAGRGGRTNFSGALLTRRRRLNPDEAAAKSERQEEAEAIGRIPYVCLNHLNNAPRTPRNAQNYGPLYLVS